jgi:hypothetical protein
MVSSLRHPDAVVTLWCRTATHWTAPSKHQSEPVAPQNTAWHGAVAFRRAENRKVGGSTPPWPPLDQGAELHERRPERPLRSRRGTAYISCVHHFRLHYCEIGPGGELGAETVEGALALLGGGVCVDGHGGVERGTAGDLLHHVRWGVLLQEQGQAGVPKVVEPDRSLDRLPDSGPGPADRVRAQLAVTL